MISTPVAPNPSLSAEVSALAAAAGFRIVSAESSASTAGLQTTRFHLALNAHSSKTQTLELSQSFQTAPFAVEMAEYLAESARRLLNPQPDLYLTTTGLPLRFSSFAWPFHESSAGADTSLVHGLVSLVDGADSPLHTKIAASMTVTFREALRAPEQPFAEALIYNAVRKIFDQGQLELVKSGNRQPVPVTTRYFSPRQNKFVFTDTNEEQRTAFLAAKVFWMSGKLGGGAPVWLLDPRDAQYLNASIADLKLSVTTLEQQGLIELTPDPAFASATPALMHREAEYEVELREALAFIKPTFNEEMRGGHTNM